MENISLHLAILKYKVHTMNNDGIDIFFPKQHSAL